MTSLIGASGEDFASVLRSLGYRMERRPKPVAPAEPARAADALAGGETASPPTEVAITVESATNDPGPVVDETLASPPVVDPSAVAAQDAPGTGAAEEKPIATESAAEPAAATASDHAATTDRQAPVLVDVWRPGRVEGRQRPRDKRRERHRPPRTDAPAPAVGAAADTQSRPSGDDAHRPQRPPRGERGRPQDRRRERPERPDRERGPMGAARLDRRERERAPDPNSPFAKLAALKAQLEAEAKERR
jgi:ATP-dependent RNA helicase SUPV3L1/SUV3